MVLTLLKAQTWRIHPHLGRGEGGSGRFRGWSANHLKAPSAQWCDIKLHYIPSFNNPTKILMTWPGLDILSHDDTAPCRIHCHDLIILISDWYLPITYHFQKITLRNHLWTTHHTSHPNSSIHNSNQRLSDDQILLNSDSLISCHNCSMAVLGLCAITIPIFSRGIFGRKCPLPTLEFTR